MSEPTSALTFGDFLLEAAHTAGVAYYGVNGDEPPQIPTNPHDLADMKRIVNHAIRMFIADMPPTGWRWLSPTRELVLWPSIAKNPSREVTAGPYDSVNNETTLTANEDVFFPSMEHHDIVIETTGSFEILRYISAIEVVVRGDASGLALGYPFAIPANGNYTLPRDCSGVLKGPVTFTANTHNFQTIEWTTEAVIRRLREDASLTTTTPSSASIRPMTSVRRRWELMAHPIPEEIETVEFPYEIYFQTLDAVTDFLPVPFRHDETLRAATRAVVEADIEDNINGPQMQRYKELLQQSYLIDAKSAPRRIGVMTNPTQPGSTLSDFKDWRRFTDRPNVNTSAY